MHCVYRLQLLPCWCVNAVICSSQACKLFAGSVVACQAVCWQRPFCSSPFQPNPLSNTGVGSNPVGSHSAPDSDSLKPNPLAATTAVNVGGPVPANSASSSSAPTSGTSGKPDPLAASTNVKPDSAMPAKPDPLAASTNVKPDNTGAAKPDPLAASTNVKPDTSGAATASESFQQVTFSYNSYHRLTTLHLNMTHSLSLSFACNGLQSTYDGPPKLIVFGGNGFVGTRVCEEALQTGLAVVSINRSGPPKATAPWTSDVEWVSVSLLPLHHQHRLLN